MYSESEIKAILEENRILKQKSKVIDDFLIITKTDSNGFITYANQSFVDVSEYSEAELIGQAHNIVRHPSISKSFFRAMWHKLKFKKESWRGIVKNLTKTGKVYYVESLISPIFNNHNEIVEYISVIKDITKRVERELELNSEKKFITNILDHQDSIILLTNEEQGMLYVNQKFFDYVEFATIHEFKNAFKCVGEIFIPDNNLIFSRAIDWIEHIYQNSEKVHKAKLVGKNGQVHYFSIRVNKIRASKSRIRKYNLKEDQSDLYLMTLSEITELETALQKAQSGIEAKSRFLANMSHEIRTPLNGILGFTELMRKSPLSPDQEKYINTISSSSKTLLGIINDILDFSKVESGNLSLEYIKCSPLHEFESALNLFSAKMMEKRIKYLLFIDPMLPKWIILDPLRIKQIISNLVGNALKFTPENGKISVDISCVRGKDHDIELYFSVQDSGIGISPEQRKRIFTPFSQADESTTRRFGGTGLGLSISKSFVELMGGTLSLESELDKGSKFSFNIPFVEASHEKSVETRFFSSIDTIIYNPIYSIVSDEVYLLQKYLLAFGLTVKIEPEFNKLNNSRLIWIFASSIPEPAFVDIKLLAEKTPIVLIESFNTKLSYKINNVKRVQLPFNMSSIDDAIVNSLQIKLENELFESSKGENLYFNNLSVLVAEDNDVNQMFIDILLKGYGIQPDIVENGELAIKKAENKVYDLVLMDINMPILGGIEATHGIRKKGRNGEKIPIIALTANAIVGDRERFMSEGMDDYLTKPIDIKNLEKILIKYLVNNTVAIDKNLNQQDKQKEQSLNKKDNEDKNKMIEVPVNNFEQISKAVISKELGIPEMFVTKLITKFLDGLETNVRDVEGAISRKNSEEIKNFAHKLKGSSANLRFKYLAEIMKTIEYAGKDNITEGYEKLLEAMKKEIETVRAFAVKK